MDEFKEQAVKARKGELIRVGWREWVELPGLGIPGIKAKVDTGARTSALHTCALETFRQSGRLWVRFSLHPLARRRDLRLDCVAEVIDRRTVTDSGGHREQRYVIEAPVRLAGREWPIEITLTNREDMLFRMLLGRTAITAGGMIVDPAASYVRSRSLRRRYPPRTRS